MKKYALNRFVPVLFLIICLVLPATVNAALRYCPKCGKMLQPVYSFCPYCGFDLRYIDDEEDDYYYGEDDEDDTVQPTQTPKKNGTGLAIDNLATRYGPSTAYREPGTYTVKGQYVKIISMKENNGTTWVQCEVSYGGTLHRVYTGLKRFDTSTIDFGQIRIESDNDQYGYVKDNSRNLFRDGPGTNYGVCRQDPNDKEGNFRDVAIVCTENGWTQVEFYQATKPWRAWTKKGNVVSYGHKSTSKTTHSYLEENGRNNDWPVGSVCRILASPAGSARSGPGLAYSGVDYVYNSDEYIVLEYTLGDTGRDWYRIELNGRYVWISSGIVEVDGHKDGTRNGKPLD